MIFSQRLISLLLLLLVPAVPAAAAVFRVNSDQDAPDLEPGDGLCVAYLTVAPPYVLAHCTLRAAIQEANALPGGDEIRLGPGTFRMDITGSDEDEARSGDYDIRDSLKIIGAGADKTFIDADHRDRILDIVDPRITVDISGVSLVNGDLSHSTESLPAGGAIRNRGALIINDSVIADNIASTGGAVANVNGADLQVTGSTISGNHALAGAGLVNDGNATLINTTVSTNQARGNAAIGGGIDNRGSLSLIQSTVAENRAPTAGGIKNNGILTLLNSLLADNRNRNCTTESQITSRGHNLDSDGTCLAKAAEGDIRNRDPLLAPLRDNGGSTPTHALPYNSPAVNRGATLVHIPFDQRGHDRSLDAAWDIGAFEASLSPVPLLTPLLLGGDSPITLW